MDTVDKNVPYAVRIRRALLPASHVPRRYLDGIHSHDFDDPAAQAMRARQPTRLRDVMFFYANIIDYARVVTNLVAALFLYGPWGTWPATAAVLIYVAVLLDWIDGPVARAYKQGSNFGSGVDWFADMQGYALIAMWWVKLEPSAMGVAFTCVTIELCACIFDYAATTSGLYPRLSYPQTNPFYKIFDISYPASTYSNLGTFMWLAYPALVLARCLSLEWGISMGWLGPWERATVEGGASFNSAVVVLTSAVEEAPLAVALWVVQAALFVPAVLYVWNEAAQAAFIISHWSEPLLRSGDNTRNPVTYDDGVMAILGALTADEIKLVEDAEAVLQTEPGYAHSAKGTEVFWASIYQRIFVSSAEAALGADIRRRAGSPALAALVDRLVATAFGPHVEIDGYGFVCNPAGSRTQAWHVDYSPDYASIMIPLHACTDRNSTQYVVLPEAPKLGGTDDAVLQAAVADLDAVDVESLIDAYGQVSVRSLVCRAGTIVRMNFGAIHRGQGNMDPAKRLRTVFYVSVTRNGAQPPPEPVIKDFTKDAEKAHAEAEAAGAARGADAPARVAGESARKDKARAGGASPRPSKAGKGRVGAAGTDT